MRSSVALLAVLASLALVACGGGGGGPATGSERGPCYGNGTCNAGLVCLSNTCVKPAATGAAGTSGGAGMGGGSGTTGAGGAAGTGGSVGVAGAGGTSGSGGTVGTGGGSAGTGGGSAGSGGTAGAGGSGGGSGGGAGAVAPNCTDYCAAITSACSGTSAQYTTLAECQAVCPSFPLGSSADQTGNTLGCRAHLLAATAPATPTSCAVAGPSGGNVCGNDLCAPYCALMLAHCANTPNAYASMSACLSACASFPTSSGAYSSNVTSAGGANAYCYFAFAALTAVDPTIHCPHAVVGSITCQ